MPQVKLSTEHNKSDGVPRQSPYFEVKDMYYNMNHKRRGVALIFNHEYYRNQTVASRRGTNKDRDKLDTVLTDLGFQVELKNNLTYNEIFNTIKAVAKMDHSQNDCLLIAVLTHGDLGLLHASDTHYSVSKLWIYFTDQYCPTLAGKPKIFIIQACRGDKYDDGCTLSDNIETDGPSMFEMYDNTNHPDFLFAYSTAPGFYSWRNSSNGSWFIQTLCATLADYASDVHIMTLLTIVCRKIALDFESYTDDDESNEKKQIPNICSTLTRLIVFSNNKKKKTECCIQS